MTKVALLTDAYIPQISGVSTTIRELQKQFATKHYGPIKVYCPDYGSLDNTLGELFNTLLVVQLPAKQWSFAKNVKWVKLNKGLRDLIDASIQRFQPDVIHIATEGPLGKFGRKLATKYDIPLVASSHTDYGSYLTKYHFPKFLSGILWKWMKKFYLPARIVLSPSDYWSGVLKSHNINNVHTLSPGVDLSLFGPHMKSTILHDSLGIKQTDKIILYVGRIAPEKNLELLVEAWRGLSSHPHFKDTHLVIVGNGVQLDKYRKLEKTMDRVYVVGGLYGEVLASAYASADMLVMPSITETYGLVLLEAMASELPVIAVRSKITESIIQNWHNGVLCDNIVASLEDAIITVSTTSEERILEIKKAARNFSLTRSWEHAADELYKIYKICTHSKL